jgi:murein DD-endopeptidase MepM/ murein hydrolase activator NlpD
LTKSTDNRLSLALLVILASMLGIGYWRASGGGLHAAERPLRMPANDQAIDLRFDLPSAWQSFETPVALRFDEPLGSAGGALTYNPQPFWAMNDARGGHHTGDDLNGIGGMDSDLGDPVFAVADGLVTFAGPSSPGWGNIIIISHRTADNRRLQSMYAHLLSVDVKPGDLVARGTRIAAVGTANGLYPAHLHFEMRDGDGSDICRGYAALPLQHLDPLGTIAMLRHAAPDALEPAPLAAALATAKPQGK